MVMCGAVVPGQPPSCRQNSALYLHSSYLQHVVSRASQAFTRLENENLSLVRNIKKPWWFHEANSLQQRLNQQFLPGLPLEKD